jgi:xylulokinase
MPGFTAPKLLWVRAHEPATFAATRRVLLPKDWLRLRMTGEAITDMSDAAGTLWLDVGARRWSGAMLAATGLSLSHMPALVEGTAPAGRLRAEVAAAWGLPPGIPVAGGAGDQAAGAAALGCVRPGQGFVALGTSAVLFVCDAGFLPDPDRTVHAFCHCVPDVWHRMTVSLSGASALAWITRATGAASEAALLAEMEASTLPPPVFLPHLTGERTPHNDPAAEAAFIGLRAAHGRADLARAVLEGVAFTLAEGLEVLAARGAPAAPLVAIGGGARSPSWLRLVAAALDLPVATVQGGEVGSALGAARLARVAAGDGAAEEVFAPLPVAAVHAPDPLLQEALAPRRAVHQALYAALRPVRLGQS